MTLLDTSAIYADVSVWMEFPEQKPDGIDLLPLRWALGRIDAFSETEKQRWRAVALRECKCDCGSDNCGSICAVVARMLVLTLHAALGDAAARKYLLAWDAQNAAQDALP